MAASCVQPKTCPLGHWPKNRAEAEGVPLALEAWVFTLYNSLRVGDWAWRAPASMIEILETVDFSNGYAIIAVSLPVTIPLFYHFSKELICGRPDGR